MDKARSKSGILLPQPLKLPVARARSQKKSPSQKKEEYSGGRKAGKARQKASKSVKMNCNTYIQQWHFLLICCGRSPVKSSRSNSGSGTYGSETEPNRPNTPIFLLLFFFLLSNFPPPPTSFFLLRLLYFSLFHSFRPFLTSVKVNRENRNGKIEETF